MYYRLIGTVGLIDLFARFAALGKKNIDKIVPPSKLKKSKQDFLVIIIVCTLVDINHPPSYLCPCHNAVHDGCGGRCSRFSLFKLEICCSRDNTQCKYSEGSAFSTHRMFSIAGIPFLREKLHPWPIRVFACGTTQHTHTSRIRACVVFEARAHGLFFVLVIDFLSRFTAGSTTLCVYVHTLVLCRYDAQRSFA